jgi:DNA-binding NarL/FixJ family response regulator
LRVFIADDAPAVSEMLVELLSDGGRIEVVGVGDSEAGAIEGIRSLRPDVVVLDLQLKDGSGTNVIRAVRADPDLAATRLVVASNHVSEPMRAGCLELGADGYYDKVKELGLLASMLADLARSRRASGS